MTTEFWQTNSMAENNAPAQAPPKKGKLKLILILTLLVVLAIGLSVVGTLWFTGADRKSVV